MPVDEGREVLAASILVTPVLEYLVDAALGARALRLAVRGNELLDDLVAGPVGPVRGLGMHRRHCAPEAQGDSREQYET
jgi:hypothetical protein